MRIFTIILFGVLGMNTLQAQPVESIVPLRQNYEIKKYLNELRQPAVAPSMQVQAIVLDTIGLPFIDDFSGSKVYPDSLLWADRTVYINNSFPVNAPSYNVATFDGLNSLGNPYYTGPGNKYGIADTLSSKAINLLGNDASDSIYLSFFYQGQGLAYDSLEGRDSLVLEFFNKYGAWVRVWRSPGLKMKPFKYASLAVKDSLYFHAGFRFRFMNYGGLTGNLNNWHLDYVRLEPNRNLADTVYRDVSVNSNPLPLLKTYRSMPWKQFKNIPNPPSETRDTLNMRLRNLDNIAVQVPYQYKAYDSFGQFIAGDSSAENVLSLDTARFSFSKFTIPLTQPADSFFKVKVKYIISPANDKNRSNDTLVQDQVFSNYYAYDDGTAEAGYGINGNISGAAKVALRYQLYKADTLRAIHIFFNQSYENVQGKQFALAIWKSIGSGSQEKLAYSQILSGPVYTDRVNGFAVIPLDTPQYIDFNNYPGGVFYIGWIQTSSFVLNVGFDLNYSSMLSASQVLHPHLSFNVDGTWESSLNRGALMMRPVLGSRIDDPLNVPEQPAAKASKNRELDLYPNPVQQLLHIQGHEPGGRYRLSLIDLRGTELLQKELKGNSSTLQLDDLQAGMYLLKMENLDDHSFVIKKFIKQ